MSSDSEITLKCWKESRRGEKKQPLEIYHCMGARKWLCLNSRRRGDGLQGWLERWERERWSQSVGARVCCLSIRQINCDSISNESTSLPHLWASPRCAPRLFSICWLLLQILSFFFLLCSSLRYFVFKRRSRVNRLCKWDGYYPTAHQAAQRRH